MSFNIWNEAIEAEDLFTPGKTIVPRSELFNSLDSYSYLWISSLIHTITHLKLLIVHQELTIFSQIENANRIRNHSRPEDTSYTDYFWSVPDGIRYYLDNTFFSFVFSVKSIAKLYICTLFILFLYPYHNWSDQ